MRIIFAASPAIAIPSLNALADMALTGGCVFPAILTNADSVKGRGRNASPTAVGTACTQINEKLAAAGKEAILQLKPHKLDEAFFKEISALKPDLLVSFAYGTIFSADFLKLFPLGGINVHPSLLPKYRGPTPIQAAILNSDTQTGITIQRLCPEVDSGDILAQEALPLAGRETTESLSFTVAEKAAAMLPQALISIKEGARYTPQKGKPSYCKKIEKDDSVIDWHKSAASIDTQVRAFQPLCRTTYGDSLLFILEGEPIENESSLFAVAPNAKLPCGAVLGIDKKRGILIKCGSGVYAVQRLQLQARKALDWKSFLNGARNFTQAVLGNYGFKQ